MEHALPLGVVGRTVELRRDRTVIANLVCLSELTQHQLSIAVLASGAGKEAFYAGLFHDVYKSAMNWRRKRYKWSWYHLVDEHTFKDILMPLNSITRVDITAHQCAHHHRDDTNPIRVVERRAVPAELKVPLPEELRKVAYNVASFSTRSPYRAFVASLLIEKLLSELNEAYAQLFDQKFGLKELHAKYVFKQYQPFSENPVIDYDDGVLSAEIPVRAPPSLKGLVIEHHYLPTLDRPSLSVEEKHVELRLRFSDALAFPIIGYENVMLWAITPFEGLGKGQDLKKRLIRAFEEAKGRALDNLLKVSGVKPDLADRIRDALPDELSEYIPPRTGEPKCMFCGARATFRVARSLERFVDVDRIVAFNITACAPCKLAYDIENARRASVPLCIIPLPATPTEAEALDTFREGIVQGDFPIPTHALPPVKTALEEPWARTMSWAFYNAVLRDPDEFGLRKLKSPREIDIPLFRFFLSRSALLYPFVFRIRPAALISAWTTTGKKKFVLNVDTASEFVLLPGAERDLTLEDIDVLAPLVREGKNVLRKAYSVMRQLYELGVSRRERH